MRTKLLEAKFSRLMTRDGDTVDAVNDHFLTLKSTSNQATPATLPLATCYPALRDAYNKIIDDLDDAKQKSPSLSTAFKLHALASSGADIGIAPIPLETKQTLLVPRRARCPPRPTSATRTNSSNLQDPSRP